MNGPARYPFCVLAAICLVSGLARAGDLPSPDLTPGALNPDVTQENIHQTVCVKGWTKTLRPPAYYTNGLKKAQIRQYGLADRDPRDYEEDHLVSLSLGGHPTDPRNLWPQPRHSQWGADQKDDLEFVLFKMVCRHEIGLAKAQSAMATNWIEAYKRFVPSHPNERLARFAD